MSIYPRNKQSLSRKKEKRKKKKQRAKPFAFWSASSTPKHLASLLPHTPLNHHLRQGERGHVTKGRIGGECCSTSRLIYHGGKEVEEEARLMQGKEGYKFTNVILTSNPLFRCTRVSKKT